MSVARADLPVFQEPSPPPRPAGHLRLRAVGDSGLLVELGTSIDPDIQARVLQLDASVAEAGIEGVVEAIVGYTTLLIVFDPARTDFDALVAVVHDLAGRPVLQTKAERSWRVPVAYGGEFGLDIEEACRCCNLSADELIAAHAGADYSVAMFGFLPGFAYLSGLPPRLAMPRRATPRQAVPGGTIAIGGPQTAIGSVPGPCGWNVIGRTPLRTFDAARYPATFFKPGDAIRFVPIDARAFHELAARAEAGEMIAERAA